VAHGDVAEADDVVAGFGQRGRREGPCGAGRGGA
jgi:hypothetical protein